MLTALRNKYDGIFIASDALPESKETFDILLKESISYWSQQDIKVVWLEISATKCELIQAAINNGFEFHHCFTSKLILTKRLINNSYIPSFSTHTIGAGAVVLSEERKILVVLEKMDLVNRPQYYKLPGGMLERGEHMSEGVVREVFEETGIKSEFKGLLSFRHHHRGQFNTSNIYAVFLLKPLSFDISIDETEIGRAMWVSVDDYLSSPGVGEYNKLVVKAAVFSKPLVSVKIDGYMDSPNDYEIYAYD
ncbi:MAG: NUDIX domain-containing protein [Acidobacteria bacterium]|nr:NUDIX domain-containing protein [Acidobacteriota bacterium]